MVTQRSVIDEDEYKALKAKLLLGAGSLYFGATSEAKLTASPSAPAGPKPDRLQRARQRKPQSAQPLGDNAASVSTTILVRFKRVFSAPTDTDVCEVEMRCV